MGAFVLGILVGWVLEWVFYTFWLKPKDSEDCSSIKAELELKNRQISSLQSQLASVTESSTSATGKSSQKTAVAAKTKTTASKSVSVAKTKSPATKTKSKPKAVVSTTKTKAKPKKTASPTKRGSKKKGDDFTKLSGIGPSMSATLKSLGIDTFAKLASTEDQVLRDLLENSGAKMNNNKDVMDSWNEQATLAANGDFATLKQMQDRLKK